VSTMWFMVRFWPVANFDDLTPFVQVGMTQALTRPETVKQRPRVMSEIKTRLYNR